MYSSHVIGGRRSGHLCAKRAIDLAIASAGLLVAIPLSCIIAIVIKLDSPGPVLFTQERLGLFRQPFTCLKFRTMRVDADSVSWVMPRDPRITRVGRFLRQTRLDELPQFINVLRGDMSIVGPRPMPAHEAEILADLIPEIRFSVRPGITGWAQVLKGCPVTLADQAVKFRLDASYVRRQSLWFDLDIIVRTIGVLVSGKGL